MDFAGQPLYYNTHQFFVTTDTIYLVVFNLAHESLARAEYHYLFVFGNLFDYNTYWLHTLEVRAKGSPIVVVGTNADDKKCTKSYIKVLLNCLNSIKCYVDRFRRNAKKLR